VETAAVYLGQCDQRALPKEQKLHAVDVRNYLKKLRDDLKTGGSEGVMSQLREVTATLRPTLGGLDAPARTVLQIASLLHLTAWPYHGCAQLRGKAIRTGRRFRHRRSDPWTQLIRGLIGMRLFQPRPNRVSWLSTASSSACWIRNCGKIAKDFRKPR